MEDLLHACQSDLERERVRKVNDRLGKSHQLPKEKMMRKWCEDGGEALESG